MRDDYLARYRPLVIEANRAWWDAAITGSDDDFRRRKEAENALAELHSDRETFESLRALAESGSIDDPVLKRELLVMERNFLEKQADPELNRRIIELEADVEQIFNTHRSVVDDKRLTENEVREILTSTRDTELARKAWSGYMAVGRKVKDRLAELVRLRNRVARGLGFANFFSMRIEIQEFDEEELFAIFDELDELTREPFAALKREIDAHMIERFGIAARDLGPWHTADLFFQEAPDLGDVRLDDLYRDRDPVALSAKHFESMGLEVADILARSDLYEKEGKSPHAFCTNIDRDQDIRVLCNVKPNANWMDTVHHELGHGVYDKYVGRDVPFLLHGPSHILTTEGIAMLFGALTRNEEFLARVLEVPAAQLPTYAAEARRSLRAEKLIFSRWAQVMLRFERAMYSEPGQDLNALWWRLKKQYQLLDPPDDMSGADYGAKMHVVGAPVYYHNYMLGDLFSSQVAARAARELGIDDPRTTCFHGSEETGEFLRQRIFAPGNLRDWRELTVAATGEPLTAKYYAAQFVE